MYMNKELIRLKMALLIIYNNKLKIKIPENTLINLNKINISNNYNLQKIISNIDDAIHTLKQNPFISENILNDISSRCEKKIIFTSDNRNIIIYGNDNDEVDKLVLNINSILNMFDSITKKTNKYKINIFLSNQEKQLNEQSNEIGPDSINSGSTNGIEITLWRKEELLKVLVHEIVHYLNLDIYDKQDEIRFLYDNINIKFKTNPNEAYTEYTAIILYNYWKFKTTKTELSLKKFMERRLTVELGWSFFQISKILIFFQCYKEYNDLFTKKCLFNQKTNVLSYFILKTHFLFDKNMFLKLNLFSSKNKNVQYIKERIRMKNVKFGEIVNNCISLIKNNDIPDYARLSMRMSCLD